MIRPLKLAALFAGVALALPALAEEPADEAPEPPDAEPSPSAADERAPTDQLPPGLDLSKRTDLTPETRKAMEAVMERFGDRPELAKAREALGQTQRDAVGPPDSDPVLRRAAGRFFFSLVRGDLPGVLAESRTPFQLEGESLPGEPEFKRRVGRLIDPRPLAGLLVYGIEVMPLEKMVERYGAPPARLGVIPAEAWIGVANVGGNALVAVFVKDARNAWKAVAFTD